MRRIAFVRHGETEWNRAGLLHGRVDMPLNVRGVGQAGKAASRLETQPWDVLVTSPLARATSTAAVIGHRLNMPVESIAGLTEQAFGEAEGIPRVEAALLWPTGDYPGGENRDEVLARSSEALKRLTEKQPGMNAIVVCHVVVIRCLVLALTGSDPGFVGNGSVTETHRDAGTGRWSKAHRR